MKPDNVYLIGLTGNIACGKSTIVDMVANLGASTLDADQVTHQLQQPGTNVYHEIVATFGPGIRTSPDGPIDRRALGAIVFGDPAALKQLEAIVHPYVHANIQAWLQDVGMQSHGTHRVAVIDAIKLLETGWRQQSDAIWVVTCREDQQVQRLMHTRGMTEADARQRLAAQPPQAEKIKYADVVIDNSGTLEQTRAQVYAAWEAIRVIIPNG